MKHLTIENKTGRVKLDDTVDSYSRKELAKEMAKVFGAEAFTNPDFLNLTNSAENEVDRLEIEINSPGGSVMDGMLIVNELRAMSGKGVHTIAIVNVLAASMGSVIAASCDECLIVDNGRMMIHDVSVGVRGTAKDLTRMAELCEGMSNEIAGIYAAKTGKTTEEMRALMQDETWLDAKQCIDLGLADGFFDFRATAGNITDMSLLARLTTPAQPEALEKIQGLETDNANLQNEIKELTDKLTLAEFALQDAATLKAECDTLTAKLEESERVKAEHKTAIAAHVAQSELDKQAHAEALKAAQASTAAKAVEIAASAGIAKPLEIIGDDSAKATTIEEIQAKLEAEKDPAKRTILYREFKAAIKAAK